MPITADGELRKLQVTGGSTFVISLPKTWVEQMGLKRGSVVKITRKDDVTLCLTPQRGYLSETPRKVIITLAADDSPDSVVRMVVSAYLMGYNIIQLRSNQQRFDSGVRFKVKDFTRKKLMGTEILSDLPQDLALQVLLSHNELSVKDALCRMSVITAAMHRDAIEALGMNENQLAREVVAMDDEVDRFNFYIIRLLTVAVTDDYFLKGSGLKSPRECLSYRLITKSIERVADHAVNIAQNQLALTRGMVSQDILDEVKKLSDFALMIFENAMNSVFDEVYKEADEILDMALKTRELEAGILHNIVKQMPPEDIPVLRLIIESISRTAEYGADISETVLNMTVRDAVIEA